MNNKLSITEVDDFIEKFKKRKKGGKHTAQNPENQVHQEPKIQQESQPVESLFENGNEIKESPSLNKAEENKKQFSIPKMTSSVPTKGKLFQPKVQKKVVEEVNGQNIFGNDNDTNDVENIFDMEPKTVSFTKKKDTAEDIFNSQPKNTISQPKSKVIFKPKIKPPTINKSNLQKKIEPSPIQNLPKQQPKINEKKFTPSIKPVEESPFQSKVSPSELFASATTTTEPPKYTNLFPEENNDLSMKNVYTNFKNELNPKTTFFQSDDIANEIEKLDADEDVMPKLDDTPQNQPLESKYQSNFNRNFQLESEEENCYLKTIFQQNYFVTTLDNKITLCPLNQMLLNNYEQDLYSKYFPTSYSGQVDLSSYYSLLDSINNYYDNNIQGLEKNFNAYIAIFLLLNLLKNNLNLKKSNILLKENSNLRIAFINNLKFKISSMKKNIIKVNHDVPCGENEIFYDISDENSLESLKDNFNLTSFFFLSLTANSSESFAQYAKGFFDRRMIEKNNGIYFQFLINNYSSNLSLLEEDQDAIFCNFPLFFLKFIENYNEANSNNLNDLVSKLLTSTNKHKGFMHYIILTFLSNDFSSVQASDYLKVFSNYLNVPSIQKIIIADVFNYILLCVNKSISEAIAKCSIMLKFKYVLLRQYDNDPRVKDLGEKINQNIMQFGGIGKNHYFKEYFDKNYPTTNTNTTFSYNNPRTAPIVKEVKNEVTTITTSTNNETNINTPPINTNQAPPTTNSSGGIFSFFSQALGISGSGNTEPQKKDIHSMTEEEKKMLTPEELWELEHPGEPEVYYDETLKRYVLRGKIYNDQEEVEQKKKKERPFVPPPKFKPSKPAPNKEDIFKVEESENQKTEGPSGGVTETTQKPIINPFGKKAPKPTQQKNKFKMPRDLSNRYAVGYEK